MLREIIDMAKRRRFSTQAADEKRNGIVHATKAHEKLVDLIEARDGRAAGAFWRKHLVEANRFLLEFPGREGPLDVLD